MYTIVLCHLRLAQHKLNESDISAYEKNHICEKQFNKENKSIFINKWFDLFSKYFIEFYTIIVDSVTMIVIGVYYVELQQFTWSWISKNNK